MLWNSQIVSYFILSLISVLLGLMAITIGFFQGLKWRKERSIEERYYVEKVSYLGVTIVQIGLFLRLVMIPFWFFALSSAISSVPGAMCLTGVHQLDPPYSYIATILKFIFSLGYGFWLILHSFDRRTPYQDLMGDKLFFLIPIGLLVLIESFFDLHFLLKLKPRPVSCCGSIFDKPSESIPAVITQSHWGWVIVLFICSILLIIYSFKLASDPMTRLGKLVVWVASPLCMISFILASHTKFSPLFLKMPLHHCFFCLWRDLWDFRLALFLIIGGAWIIFSSFTISIFKHFQWNEHTTIHRFRLLRISGYLLSAGLLILIIRTLISF